MSMNIIETVKSNIVKQTDVAGLSQAAVAERLGISRQALNEQINAGSIRISRLYEIAEILNCEVSDFFEDAA